MAEQINDIIPVQINENIPEQINNIIPEQINDIISEHVDENVPEHVDENVPEHVDENVPEHINEIVSEPEEEKVTKSAVEQIANKNQHNDKKSARNDCKGPIEEQAKILIQGYDELSSKAKAHFIAELLVLFFLEHTVFNLKDFMDSDTPNSRDAALKLIYQKLKKSDGNNSIKKELIEQDCNTLPELKNNECPVYRIFSLLNKECRGTHFMINVGVEAQYNSKNTILGIDHKVNRSIPMLNIIETMEDKNIATTFGEYIKTLKAPMVASDRLYKIDTATPGVFVGFHNTLIFYYDAAHEPKMELPGSIDIKKYAKIDQLYTYKLKSVILADGDINDVFEMRVLDRPKENADEFVKVANAKGCYFLYEYSP
ncbi:hypothetical protein ENBRE01_0343 [Enteropsectra breve]|nr:hypothetical protein ENBRE01_0343 [Enteropsectra breve]